MKKVLFVSYSLCHGGAERSLLQTLEALDKDKYDVTLFLCSEKNNDLIGLVPEYVKVIVDKTKPHYFRRPKAIWLNLMRILLSKISKKSGKKYTDKLNEYIHTQKARHPADTYFKNEKFDIVVANNFGFVSEVASYIPARRHFMFYRSSVETDHELNERVFAKCEKILPVGTGVKAMLCEKYPESKDKMYILQDYVEYDEIAALAEHDIDDDFNDKLLICSCGRITREKGFDLAARAAKLLKETGLDFRWIIIGDGEKRKDVEQIIESESLGEYVVLLGAKDDPFPYIKKCDIFVQPSYEESYGRTIAEALILGRPVVSTRTVGGESVLQNGKLGVLTDISAQGLATGIKSLTDDPEKYKSLVGIYTREDNEKEKDIFKNALEDIMSR